MITNALRTALQVGTLTTGLCLAVPSHAQQATLVGPSVAKVGAVVELSMKGVRANASHSVAMLRPGAAEAHLAAVSDVNGTLSHRFTPLTRGAHEVRVLNSKGQVIATARVMAH